MVGMPAQHTLHVALSEDLVRYVREQVATGPCRSASELVREALLMHSTRYAVAINPEGSERDPHK
jgi:Arc/MetJ-type ribon-helix-helix transcriptional regulator